MVYIGSRRTIGFQTMIIHDFTMIGSGRTMKYLRLYADEEGESHVEIVRSNFDMQAHAPPAPAIGVSAPKASRKAPGAKL